MKLFARLLLICCMAGCAATSGTGTADSNGAAGLLEKAKGWLDPTTSAKPILSDLAPGPYAPAPTAIGVEKDLKQRRGQLFGVVPDPALHAYVNRIRAELLRGSGVTDVPGSVYLVATPELNAVSTADGNIFMSIAWLGSLTDEDQLAALLAHELSHILLRHHTSDIVGRTQKRAVAGYHEGLKLRAKLLDERIDKGDNERLSHAELSIKLMQKGFLPAWGRRQEQEADFLANDLLVKAGYNLNGMIVMLEVLKAFDDASSRSEESVQKELEELQELDKITRKDVMTAFKAAGARIVDTFSASHPPVAQRLEAVATYQDMHYAEVELPEPREAQYQSAIQPALPVIANYRKSYEARALLLQRKTRDAYPPAREGAAAPTATAVYPNWVLFLAASGTRNQQEAFEALERAYHNPRDPVNAVYQEYSEQLGARRRYREALAVAEQGYQQFDQAPDWLAPRIRWMTRLNRKKEAEQLASQCALQYPDYREACLSALERRPVQSAGR